MRRSGWRHLLARRAWPPSWLGLLWTTSCLSPFTTQHCAENMTEYAPSVKVKYTSLCNNFFYATKIRDEAQGRARAGDPPENHRGRRGAAPERGPCADHSERRSREGRGAEAHLLRPLPRAQGPLPGLHGPLLGAKPRTRALLLDRHRRRRRAP